jgi:hypothetical protein
VIGTEDIASPSIPFFALFVVIWAVMMLEYWKREESMCALRWGMVGYEKVFIFAVDWTLVSSFYSDSLIL